MLLHPGESEARGWQVAKLDDVVVRLFEASAAVDGRPRVIAIDGRGGAGKSMLAEQLGERVPGSAVVHTDDIAWHHAMFDSGFQQAVGETREDFVRRLRNRPGVVANGATHGGPVRPDPAARGTARCGRERQDR